MLFKNKTLRNAIEDFDSFDDVALLSSMKTFSKFINPKNSWERAKNFQIDTWNKITLNIETFNNQKTQIGSYKNWVSKRSNGTNLFKIRNVVEARFPFI